MTCKKINIRISDENGKCLPYNEEGGQYDCKLKKNEKE